MNSLQKDWHDLQILQSKTAREFDLGTHISLLDDYVYFQVSKSASSTVKHYLQVAETRFSERRTVDVNDRNLSPHLWPSSLSKARLEEVLFSASFRRITFVRNPYARTLSCYLHRIMRDLDSASNRALKRANGGRGGPDVSFSEFVEVICDQPSKEQESHWRVQHDEVLFDKVGAFSFIGKVERLGDDLRSMLSTLGIEGIAVDDELNQSPAETRALEKLREYYDDNLQAKILDRFKADFEAFDYPGDMSAVIGG